MDHSVKAMNSYRKVALSRFFNRRRFENAELEGLFQRYIFKLQQSSIASCLALFVLLTGALAVVQLAFLRSPSVASLYHLLHCTGFTAALVFVHNRFVRDGHLLALCYGLLLSCVVFCAVAMPADIGARGPWGVGSWGAPHTAADGVWEIVFVLFLAYTMLPVKTRVAVVLGILLPVTHTTVAALFAYEFPFLLWQQCREPCPIRRKEITAVAILTAQPVDAISAPAPPRASTKETTTGIATAIEILTNTMATTIARHLR